MTDQPESPATGGGVEGAVKALNTALGNLRTATFNRMRSQKTDDLRAVEMELATAITALSRNEGAAGEQIAENANCSGGCVLVPREDEALLWMMRVISAAGGVVNSSDYKGNLLSLWFEDREPTDTFNLAHERGYLRTAHDTSYDHSTTYLTDSGREWLENAAAPASPADGGGKELVMAALNAKLPDGFQWGDDAMEQFNFGKECAARAVEAALASRPAVEGKEEVSALVAAARAVVDRWETPFWKDAEPTAHFMNQLGSALRAFQPEFAPIIHPKSPPPAGQAEPHGEERD